MTKTIEIDNSLRIDVFPDGTIMNIPNPHLAIVLCGDDSKGKPFGVVWVLPDQIQPLREALATADGLLAEAVMKGGDAQ